MPIIRSIENIKNISNTAIVYISLDTTEGGLCVGHWIRWNEMVVRLIFDI